MLLLHFADRLALTLFLGMESPSVAIAEHINSIVSWGFILFGVTMVVFGTVRATGAVIVPLVIIACSLIGVRIGFTALFEQHLGADAIWWSFPLSSMVSMLLALCYYRFGNWRSASMAARPVPVQPTLAAEQTECATKPS